MYQIILWHRHTVIKDHLLDLCKVNRINISVHLKLLHKLCHVKGTITGINVLHDNLSSHRKFGIERNLRVLTMAAQAATLIKDLPYLFILRQFRRWSLVHHLVDNHKNCCNRQQQG